MAGIFISYRRVESKAHARLIHGDLQRRFGRARVFMDVDGLKPGENFRDKIGRQLDGCTVLLALIGPQWSAVRDERGGLRLHDARDWVRVEIATALQRGITVIPVLIDGATMPRESELPEDLRGLLDRHAFTLDLDRRFEAGMEELAGAVGMGRRWGAGWVEASAVVVGLVSLAGAAGYVLKPAPAPAPVAAAPVVAPVPAPPAPPPDPFPAGKQFRDCEDAACPVMVVIPAGSFMMGSPDSEPERSTTEGPQHRVSITKFALGQYEVTQGQWTALMGSNPSYFKDCGDICPVEQVSWDDAQAYVKKLSEKTGQKYRLPSEAEWEYAARAGTTTPFHTGQTITTGQANFDGDGTYNGIAKPVGSFKGNDFGLSDMHGNVWEWVQDCWHDNYQGAPVEGHAWETECNGEVRRVLRSGSWNFSGPRIVRSAIRFRYAPIGRHRNTGFRIARTFSL